MLHNFTAELWMHLGDVLRGLLRSQQHEEKFIDIIILACSLYWIWLGKFSSDIIIYNWLWQTATWLKPSQLSIMLQSATNIARKFA